MNPGRPSARAANLDETGDVSPPVCHDSGRHQSHDLAVPIIPTGECWSRRCVEFGVYRNVCVVKSVAKRRTQQLFLGAVRAGPLLQRFDPWPHHVEGQSNCVMANDLCVPLCRACRSRGERSPAPACVRRVTVGQQLPYEPSS